MIDKDELLKNSFVDKIILSDEEYEKNRAESVEFFLSCDEAEEKLKRLFQKV